MKQAPLILRKPENQETSSEEIVTIIQSLFLFGLLIKDSSELVRFHNLREMSTIDFKNQELSEYRATFIVELKKISQKFLVNNFPFIEKIFQKLIDPIDLDQFILIFLNSRNIEIYNSYGPTLSLEKYILFLLEKPAFSRLWLLPRYFLGALAIEIYHLYLFQKTAEEIIQEITGNRDQEPNSSAIARKWSYPISKIQKIWETIDSIICQIQQNGFINDEIEEEIGEYLIKHILDKLEEARIITRVEEE